MSLLTIAQDASDEIGISRPATAFANTSPEVQKLVRLSNKVGYRLMRLVPWQILRKEHTFTSLAAETQIADITATLTDFDRIIPETFWNRTDILLQSGVTGPTEWQGFKANAYTNTQVPKYIIRGNALLITPTLTSGKSMAFEYVSQNWCQSSGGTGQAKWAADTDTGVLNEELLTLGLIYAFLDAEGLPAGSALAHFEEAFQTLVENDQPASGVMVAGDIWAGGRHFDGAPPASGFSEINWAGL